MAQVGRKKIEGHMAGNVNTPISCLAADHLRLVHAAICKQTGYDVSMKAVLTKLILNTKIPK